MSPRWPTRLAGIIGLLTVSIATVRANDQYTTASSPGVVTLSEVSYSDLISRLEALEAAVGADAHSRGGWPEVDMGTKPTQKWTGRVHLDHWAFPSTDEGSNFFENEDPTLPPGDRVLFRRLRLDPALMSGPLITTIVDIAGIFIYFEIARRILGI